jgi:hypothetical protein
MIKMQGKDIANKGGAPGAVVTVKCDYRAVSELSVLFTRWAHLAVQGLQQLMKIYRLVKGRVNGGYQLISILSGMAQARRPTLLHN